MSAVSRVVLSVCISTRNRADLIGETLDSLVSQARESVEILVLDGASTDGTGEVVSGYQRRCPSVRYIRLDQNGGIDRDFDRAVEIASGEYCWLMSDDDILHPGAIDAVLASISDDISLIVVNAEVRSRDMKMVLESRRMAVAADIKFGPDQLSELFVVVAAYASFIGCIVIRRSVWVSRLREPYFGSMFVHMGVLFQERLAGDALVLAKPWIAIRYSNAGWKSREFEIWMFKWPELLWSFSAVSEDARRRVISPEPWRKFSTLIFYRAKGTYSLTQYRACVRHRSMSVLARIGAVLAALVPGAFANCVALLYSFCLRDSAKMIRADLVESPFFLGKWFK